MGRIVRNRKVCRDIFRNGRLYSNRCIDNTILFNSVNGNQYPIDLVHFLADQTRPVTTNFSIQTF